MKELFWGREHELGELHRVDKQKKAALIVCMGRRRIGKSRLIQKFGTENQRLRNEIARLKQPISSWIS